MLLQNLCFAFVPVVKKQRATRNETVAEHRKINKYTVLISLEIPRTAFKETKQQQISVVYEPESISPLPIVGRKTNNPAATPITWSIRFLTTSRV